MAPSVAITGKYCEAIAGIESSQRLRLDFRSEHLLSDTYSEQEAHARGAPSIIISFGPAICKAHA